MLEVLVGVLEVKCVCEVVCLDLGLCLEGWGRGICAV